MRDAASSTPAVMSSLNVSGGTGNGIAITKTTSSTTIGATLTNSYFSKASLKRESGGSP